MDPLSDALNAVRLNGAYFYFVEAGHPWSVSAATGAELKSRVLPGSDHLMSYHVLISGRAWAGLPGEQVLLEPGDAIVFPHGDAHLVSSIAGRQRHHVEQGDALPAPVTPVYIGAPEAGDTSLLCGFLGVEGPPSNPLLSALPRVMHARGIVTGWLADFPRQLAGEASRVSPTSTSMLKRMAELMFLEAVRRHVDTVNDTSGWIAGLHDPVVGPALRALHADPARAWTLVDLAREVASSRSVVADRFTDLVGMPPMQYLTRWRLQRAADQLVRGRDKVAAIASRVGYQSEAAFSRAFKRDTGIAPAEWRRRRLSA